MALFSVPDKPVVGEVKVVDNTANVSWTPVAPGSDDATSNPGNSFYVEFINRRDAGNLLADASKQTLHCITYVIVLFTVTGNLPPLVEFVFMLR